MKLSDNGLDIIKESEALRLDRYICPAGKPTIGWGHVIRKTDHFKNNEITLEKATQLLSADTAIAQRIVNAAVKVKLTQGQYDALVSFIFNTGGGRFNETDCTLLRQLNAGEPKEKVAEQFGRWDKATVTGSDGVRRKEVLPGLTIRREKERQLFLS